MYKLDLHTHSAASPDGSLHLADYKRALEQGLLDYIAVTDHDTIEFAVEAQAALGDRIIVGQEVTTTDGELVGLFLSQAIPPQLSAKETVALILQQGGLVYVPHPFETVRKGITQKALDSIATDVAIVEVHNGRAVFQNKSTQAEAWARRHNLPGAASSDAHGWHGWGRTYSVVDRTPTAQNVSQLLTAARYVVRSPGWGVLYPKLNRVRKGVRRA